MDLNEFLPFQCLYNNELESELSSTQLTLSKYQHLNFDPRIRCTRFNESVNPDVCFGNSSIYECDYYEFDDLISLVSHAYESDLGLFSMNIHSLPKNFLKLQTEYNLNLTEVFCVSETYLNVHTEGLYSIPQFDAFLMSRVSRAGGGAAVYCRNKLNAKLAANLCLSFNNLEMVFIEFQHGSRKLLIGSTYRPPKASFTIFLKEFESVYATIDLFIIYLFTIRVLSLTRKNIPSIRLLRKDIGTH